MKKPKKPEKKADIRNLPFKIKINKRDYMESTIPRSLKGAGYVFNLTPYLGEDIWSDYSIRESFALDIAERMGISNSRNLVLYLEYPDNYEEQLEIFKDDADNNYLYIRIAEAVRSHASSESTNALNMRLRDYTIEDAAKTNDSLKGYDKVGLIIFNQGSRTTSDPNSSNFTWTFIHEAFHSVDSGASEAETQKNTLDYLYSIGLVDEIGLEYVYSYYKQYVLEQYDWAVDYGIVNIFHDKFLHNGEDYDLFYAANLVLYELLIDNNHEEHAKQVMEWIEKLPDGAYNEDTYKGIWL